MQLLWRQQYGVRTATALEPKRSSRPDHLDAVVAQAWIWRAKIRLTSMQVGRRNAASQLPILCPCIAALCIRSWVQYGVRSIVYGKAFRRPQRAVVLSSWDISLLRPGIMNMVLLWTTFYGVLELDFASKNPVRYR
jgi:hypothetical protein